jgi:hypothetical protein
VFFFIGSGITAYKTYENEQEIWTPEGNQSLMNLAASEDLFTEGSTARIVSVIATAKQPNVTYTPNVITKVAFQEMIDWENMLFSAHFELDDSIFDTDANVITRPGKGNPVFFQDICKQINSTDDEDDRLDPKGPTPPVVIGPKCVTS